MTPLGYFKVTWQKSAMGRWLKERMYPNQPQGILSDKIPTKRLFRYVSVELWWGHYKYTSDHANQGEPIGSCAICSTVYFHPGVMHIDCQQSSSIFFMAATKVAPRNRDFHRGCWVFLPKSCVLILLKVVEVHVPVGIPMAYSNVQLFAVMSNVACQATC